MKRQPRTGSGRLGTRPARPGRRPRAGYVKVTGSSQLARIVRAFLQMDAQARSEFLDMSSVFVETSEPQVSARRPTGRTR